MSVGDGAGAAATRLARWRSDPARRRRDSAEPYAPRDCRKSGSRPAGSPRWRADSRASRGAGRCAHEIARALEDPAQHRSRELAGEGVLLTRMVRGQERDAVGERGGRAVPELRWAARRREGQTLWGPQINPATKTGRGGHTPA